MPILEWRVKPVLPVTKLLGAAALVVLVVAFGAGDPVRWVLALAAAAGLTIWAVRDLIRPVRLTADAAGVTVVSGFASRRHLPWARIERVRVDSRTRRGLRNELLEIDAGESLHLFSAHELGTDPYEVAEALNDLRTNALTQRERP
ncbi:PH domain-containing protein [Couchioplanes caeruleus]|uniref:PH domain-containing protein n=1 Tax=Couchioplanes caeruleus TaxID=56438 RepID=UPI0020BFBA57|nr:PH domain-containing protein [Couchioplanes caeruleus]UQU65078.1 PH domain-containing protein [Couchioplanes caeruleus]